MESRAAGVEDHPPPLSTWLLAAALILTALMLGLLLLFFGLLPLTIG